MVSISAVEQLATELGYEYDVGEYSIAIKIPDIVGSDVRASVFISQLGLGQRWKMRNRDGSVSFHLESNHAVVLTAGNWLYLPFSLLNDPS